MGNMIKNMKERLEDMSLIHDKICVSEWKERESEVVTIFEEIMTEYSWTGEISNIQIREALLVCIPSKRNKNKLKSEEKKAGRGEGGRQIIPKKWKLEG